MRPRHTVPPPHPPTPPVVGGRHRTGVDDPDERIAAYRATARARAAVSWYGDPDTAWSVVLSVHLTEPVDPAAVGSRLANLCRRYPHLGAIPTVVRTHSADTLRGTFAVRPYAPREPLVRVAVGTQRPDLLIAAHHGAVDGPGMVALLGAALGAPPDTAATGLGDLPTRHSFTTAAARRLGGALFLPPTRLHRSPASGDAVPGAPRGREETLLGAALPRHAIGTTTIVATTTAVAAAWNREYGAEHGRIVVGVATSRAGDSRPEPRPRTPYLRLPVPADADRRTVRRLLASQPPEPDFPAGGAVSRLAARMLAGRFGATFLVANLGVVDVGPMVRSASYYPVVTEPAGVAFGCVTTGGTTTMTVRTRRRDFSPTAAATLLDTLVTVLPAPRPVRERPPAPV